MAKEDSGLWQLDDASVKTHHYRSFILSLLCFRVILYILKQGNAINTALENHKFHFLKLAGTFGKNYKAESLFNGGVNSGTELGENFIIDTQNEETHLWDNEDPDRVDLRPINKMLKFKNDEFKINISTNIEGISFEEIVKRTYMPIFNQILYTGPIVDNEILTTLREKAEKAITLVAIKRKLGIKDLMQQLARCKFAIESLRFAMQISSEPPPKPKPTVETMSKKYYKKPFSEIIKKMTGGGKKIKIIEGKRYLR